MDTERLEEGREELKRCLKFLDEIEPLVVKLPENQSVSFGAWSRTLTIYDVTPDSGIVGMVLPYTKTPLVKNFSKWSGELFYQANLEFGRIHLTSDPKLCKITKKYEIQPQSAEVMTFELDNPECDPLFADEGGPI